MATRVAYQFRESTGSTNTAAGTDARAKAPSIVVDDESFRAFLDDDDDAVDPRLVALAKKFGK